MQAMVFAFLDNLKSITLSGGFIYKETFDTNYIMKKFFKKR